MTGITSAIPYGFSAFDPGADLLPLITGLELLALVGIVDPPRPTARASIAMARTAGIKVRMITGDHASPRPLSPASSASTARPSPGPSSAP